MSCLKSPYLVVLVLLTALPATAVAQDPAAVAPEIYKILLENEHVRVLEMTLPPGSTDAMHSHPLAFIYYLDGGDVRLTAPDGSTYAATLKDGGHFWQQPTTHMVENIGDTTIRAVAFEIRSATGSAIALQHPPEEVAPGTNTLLIDNERIRVVETITPPGGGGTLHDHMNMVVYTVSPVKLNIAGADGVAREVEVPAGTALWMQPTTHRVTNIGNEPSHLLHVEIK